MEKKQLSNDIHFVGQNGDKCIKGNKVFRHKSSDYNQKEIRAELGHPGALIGDDQIYNHLTDYEEKIASNHNFHISTAVVIVTIMLYFINTAFLHYINDMMITMRTNLRDL
uniref:Uncharacterized protein n=1 Tax=Glossina brevipalpis TaxID=37001 RepID=A0A1A9WBL0_9MUSC